MAAEGVADAPDVGGREALVALVVDIVSDRLAPALHACLSPLLAEQELRLLAAVQGLRGAASRGDAGTTGAVSSADQGPHRCHSQHRFDQRPTWGSAGEPTAGTGHRWSSEADKSDFDKKGGGPVHVIRSDSYTSGNSTRNPWNLFKSMILPESMGLDSVQSLEDARGTELLASVVRVQPPETSPRPSLKPRARSQPLSRQKADHPDMSLCYNIFRGELPQDRLPGGEPKDNAERTSFEGRENQVRITVRVERSADASVGMDVERLGCGTSFFVTSIKPGGLIEDWNAKHPDRQVRVGDRIVEVNGQREHITKLLWKDQVLEIAVLRSAPVRRVSALRSPAVPSERFTAPPSTPQVRSQAGPAPPRASHAVQGGQETPHAARAALTTGAGDAGDPAAAPEQHERTNMPSGNAASSSSRAGMQGPAPVQEAAAAGEPPPRACWSGSRAAGSRRESPHHSEEEPGGHGAHLPGQIVRGRPSKSHPTNSSSGALDERAPNPHSSHATAITNATLDTNGSGGGDTSKRQSRFGFYLPGSKSGAGDAGFSSEERVPRIGFSSEERVVRMETEDAILKMITDGTESLSVNLDSAASTPISSNERYVASPLVLRICGLLPWRDSGNCSASVAYRSFLVLLAGGLTVIFTEQLFYVQSASVKPRDCQDSTYGACLPFQQLCDVVLALGVLLGLLALRGLSSWQLLGRGTNVLVAYAKRQHVVSRWAYAMRLQSLLLAILLLWSIALRCHVLWMEDYWDWRDLLTFGAFVVASIIFTGLAFSIMHVSCAINILIDAYCMHFRNDQNIGKGVNEWNMLQALLRKASRALKWGFLLLQASALAMLLFDVSGVLLSSVSENWVLFSDMPLILSIGLVIFKAAEVTEKCSRVPSLINSLSINNEDIDIERHYLVEYVTYSAAGFYVGDLRLTAAVALKLTYVSGLAALGILTKLTSSMH